MITNRTIPDRLKISFEELDKILEDYGLMYNPFDKQVRDQYRFHIAAGGSIVSLIEMVQLNMADKQLLVDRLVELKEEKKENEKKL